MPYLTRGQHYQELHAASVLEGVLTAELLDHWQREGHGLARAGPVAGNEVLALEDGLEGLILDGEEALDALILEHLDHLLILDEVRQLALLGELLLHHLHGLRVHVLQQLPPRFLEIRDVVLGSALGHCLLLNFFEL